ncbi:MAG TPA: hypothetical protein PK079_25505 [Leptospiraceae bacterium]|nr:hypothetical protein [Leptospiraceae bacterium]HMW05259.1 hypothetical protein [Leptospiraceae bacterium]HMX31276.1 hypothetical protein [Leptospiraceae bacterium]HMY32082.1 hypothetical protein [Leptospiraceae bacterium]HMZ67325.1 hypothetical protein [Leptospiraceae bacterium]
MNIPITSIKDAVKSLLQLLHFSTIIPVSLFLVILNYIILPGWNPNKELNSKENLNYEIVGTFLFIFLCYLLYAYNHLLIRFIEGYTLRNFLGSFELGFLNKYYELKESLSKASEKDKIAAIEKLHFEFPVQEELILPTRLGNIIAAFENYSFDKYGIDAVLLWPRMIPILEKENYLNIIAQEKGIFDFLLNLFYVILASGLLVMSSFSYNHNGSGLFFSFIITLISLYVIYNGLISSAIAWGNTIKVSFDLYRNQLWKQLRLTMNCSIDDELVIWREFSRFIREKSKSNFYTELNIVTLSSFNEYLKEKK